MLYIIGTSIGNIKDTSMRAVETLCNAQVILAEDTRTFDQYYRRIQDLYGIDAGKKQKILNYHVQNEYETLPEVLSMVDHLDVALISESGMPLISDPGNQLVQKCIQNNIPIRVIPGPTAFTTALVYAGCAQDTVTFVGFLPKKENDIIKLLKAHKGHILTAYESPHRLQKTLNILQKHDPMADVVIARELTKKYEEILRGKPAELLGRDVKGEITLVVRLA